MLAFLYKLRWRLERVFDQFKNALLERKSWCSSRAGKRHQAPFICLAHNLLDILSAKLEREEGIINETRMDARRKTIREYVQLMAELGKPPNPLLAKPLKPPQFCLQFLRVLKDRLFIPTSWEVFLGLVRPAMERYLT